MIRPGSTTVGCDVCAKFPCRTPRRCTFERNSRSETLRRAHARDDEELDVDFDPDGLAAWEREETFASGHCERRGIAGHHGAECRTVTPDLLRRRAS